MEISVVYEKNLEYARGGARRIINQGGQYSGKTVNILGVLAELALGEPNEITTVTAISMPHLKGGALRDFETYVYPSYSPFIKTYNKTDKLFIFDNNHIIEFKVFDSEQKARGSKRKRLYVNEANSFLYLIFFQLDSRSEQSIIDYNPSLRFWSHEKLIGQDGNKLIISDHRHNPFLTKEKHEEIESIPDPELWKVYARGMTGNIEGVIFPNWTMIEDSAFPDNDDCIYCVDFGGPNIPTAVMKIKLIGANLFVKECLYKTNCALIEIKQSLIAHGYHDALPVYCDHDPDSIRGLRMIGVEAFAARKGAGSITAGTMLLKGYNVFYTSSSQNLHRELGLYIYIRDKEGNLTNVPIDKNNHAIDATRMGAYTAYLRA